MAKSLKMHSGEPRLHVLPSPPRRVALPPSGFAVVLLAQLLALFFLALGLASLWSIVEEPIILAFGSDVGAYVRSAQPSPSPGRNSNIMEIHFSYDAPNGTRKTGSGPIDIGGGPVPTFGQKIPARTLKFDPFGRVLLQHQIINIRKFVFFGSCSIALCIFSLLIAVLVWMLIRRDRRLVRDGLAVPGTITAKDRTMRGNHTRYKIEFSFQALDGATHVKKSMVTYEQFHSLRQEQSVTVLYRPESPQRAVVYEASKHRVVE